MQNERCPRCGKPTIEVKDWGQAGKLFVHSRGIQHGVPTQDACHVKAEELTHGVRWSHADVDTLEALAEEISAVEGISLARALEAAREQLRSLERYAQEWDTWVAAWQDPRSGRYA